MNRTARRALVVAAWVGAGVLGASVLTGVAVAGEQARSAAVQPAAASAPSPTTGPSTPRAGAGGGLGRLRALGARVVHGEMTVRTKDGFRTVDTQLGVVTAVSATSLSVRSADGFTQTWSLGTDTVVRSRTGKPAAGSAAGTKGDVADLAVGQTVRVLGPAASGSGGQASARLVVIRPA